MKIEFEGYWSDKDKEIWMKTDWGARNFEELAVEDEEPINRTGYFYTMEGCVKRPIKFIKYIRPNPIFGPYYGPVYDSELLEFMKNGSYCYPCYDGRMEGPYKLMDRFENNELADRLSR
jgi:hypothetical protein